MNIDQVMSDQSSPVRPAASAPSLPAGDSEKASAAAAAAAAFDQKHQEEYNVARARLTDQKFNPADYADPLLPRKGNGLWLRTFPSGAEDQLRAIIAKAVEDAK